MTSPEIRTLLNEALRLDLIGPDNDHAFAHELLPQSPRRWYLTGYLVPSNAPIQQRRDEESDEEIDSVGDCDGTDDGSPPDRSPSKKSFLPSSMGLSVLLPPGVNEMEARVCWGDYTYEDGGDQPDVEPEDGDEETAVVHDAVVREPDPLAGRRGYRRLPREAIVNLKLTPSGTRPEPVLIPNSGGLTLLMTVRDIPAHSHALSRLPGGTRSVSVFLVNRRPPNEERGYKAFAFQARLELRSTQSFVPRPDLRGASDVSINNDWDIRVADLHYRGVYEYAVGHGISATTDPTSGGRIVATTWIPQALVERVSPSKMAGVELGMEALGQLADGKDAKQKLGPLVEQ